ncbi:MAG: hypothetical protein IPJ74_16965 [Saprospiraceae bacterium]|nr:hypothetical protein [Saprospiraceae bacterium]
MNTRYIILYLSVFVAFLTNNSCNSKEKSVDPLAQNLSFAGENRPELEKVLTHYRQQPEDSLKLQAAIALISNMEWHHYFAGEWMDQFDQIFTISAHKSEAELKNMKDSILAVIGERNSNNIKKVYDAHVMSAEYLIQNIDQAFDAWQRAPGSENIDFETFCNFILPYKVLNERTENWRSALQARYGKILSDPIRGASADEVLCAMNDELAIWFRYTDQVEDYPGRISFSNMMQGQRGNCSDMSALAIYAGRALGIPVAMDFVPQWGNHQLGHVWNTLIINDKESIPFLGAEGNPGAYAAIQEGEAKPAKVYRRTLLPQEDSFAAQARAIGISEEDMPGILINPRLQDVTSLYTTVADITIQVNKKRKKALFLCLFRRGDWSAIAGSVINKEGLAHFKNVGRDIIYMPMFYKDGKYEPAGNPFILNFDGSVREIQSAENQTQTIKVNRKYPLKYSRVLWSFGNHLTGAQIEGSDSPDFKNAVVLKTIEDALPDFGVIEAGGIQYRDRIDYNTLWRELYIENANTYRYVRLRVKDDQLMRLGDLAFFEKEDQTSLGGQPLGSVTNPDWAFDGVDGYSIIYDESSLNQWVGLDLGAPKRIEKIRYLISNDRNQIQPGNTYQLFYWDSEWKSLGVKKSKGLLLEFDNVPADALLWLHCTDCEQWEERPFTYENGQQIWW